MRVTDLAQVCLAILSFSIPNQKVSGAPAEAATTRQLRGYRDYAMGREGDARHGRDLFNDKARLGCVRCHSVDGTSSKAGPDLFAVGDKFPRTELVRSVLEPSAEIAVGYASTIVETRSGDVFQGVIKDSNAEFLDLMGADAKHVHIAKSDIQWQRGSNVSLMPEGLQAGLSLQEFADLIEYLASLKQPASSVASNRGMPVEISESAKPVAVRPFLTEELRFPHAYVHKPGDVRYGITWFGQVPASSNWFVVVQQTGKIWLLEVHDTGISKSLFADISQDVFNERGPNGLLGMAFHPRFRQNHKYYLKHQVFEQGQIVTTVVEREASPDFRTDSGKPSRRLWKAVATTQDHTGGCIAFGPDRMLYIGMGDTGPQQDPQGHGQDLTTPLGKMLRIDVDHIEPGLAYAIPAGNPFRARADALPEIWAYGLREPWRFSFDAVTGDLWAGDVGQDRIEEVDIIKVGENCGWNVYEGFEPFSNRYRRPEANYTPPVFAYRRKYGNCVVGGYVYRGDKQSSFYGVYICGDYTSRRIFGLKQNGRQLLAVRQIGVAPQSIASFAEDENLNLYVVGYEGMIYKLDFTQAVFDDRLAAASGSADSNR